MLRGFCAAVERRDGKAFAALFTSDGVYHDVFYGAFEGSENRRDDRRLVLPDGAEFRWEMFIR